MVPVPTKEDRDDRQTIATVIVFILPHHYSRGGGVGTDSYMAYLRTSHPSGGAKDILGGALIFHWAGLAPPLDRGNPYHTIPLSSLRRML